MKGLIASSSPVRNKRTSGAGRRKPAGAGSSRPRAHPATKLPIARKAAPVVQTAQDEPELETALAGSATVTAAGASSDAERTWFEEGFRKGQYAGGNALVDALVPQDRILPDIPIEDILAEGIEQFRSRMIPLLEADELGEKMKMALQSRSPMSVVRLGEAELLILAQEMVMPVDRLQSEKQLLERKRIYLPDLRSRDMMLDSLARASVIGVPRMRTRTGLPLFFALARGYRLDFRSMPLADSRIQYELHRSGQLGELINGRKTLLIGERAEPLAAELRTKGAKIVATYTQLIHFADVPSIVQQAKRLDFELALVAAGAASVVLTERIARECGKVALDIGYLADTLASKEAAGP